MHETFNQFEQLNPLKLTITNPNALGGVNTKLI